MLLEIYAHACIYVQCHVCMVGSIYPYHFKLPKFQKSLQLYFHARWIATVFPYCPRRGNAYRRKKNIRTFRWNNAFDNRYFFLQSSHTYLLRMMFFLIWLYAQYVCRARTRVWISIEFVNSLAERQVEEGRDSTEPLRYMHKLLHWFD